MVYPTGELVAIGGVYHGRKNTPSVVYPTGEKIRHEWRRFRPYDGADNNRGVGELVAIGGVYHGRNIRHRWCIPWAK